MMKKIFIYFVWLMLPASLMAQQRSFKAIIEIRDKDTGKLIEAATLADKSEAKFIAAQKGKFEIFYNQKMLSDTLFIDAQGYEKTKVVLSDAVKGGKLNLKKQQIPNQSISNLSKSENLNDYENNNVQHWIGFPMGNKPFSYLQVGQVFQNTNSGAQLKRIKINQLYFNLPDNIVYDDGSMTVNGLTYDEKSSQNIFTSRDKKEYMRSFLSVFIQQNEFKLRVYQLDEYNQPITELCAQTIVVDRGQVVENMKIDLSKYKIVLPKGSFMVAVEWVPNNKNFNYVVWTNWLYDMGQALRPFIGVNSKKAEKLNVMALDYGGNWAPFDYLSPYYTDLAMECDLEY